MDLRLLRCCRKLLLVGRWCRWRVAWGRRGVSGRSRSSGGAIFHDVRILIQLDLLELRDECCPYLLHALVVFDLHVDVVEHDCSHVLRHFSLEAIHLAQHALRHGGKVILCGLRHLLRPAQRHLHPVRLCLLPHLRTELGELVLLGFHLLQRRGVREALVVSFLERVLDGVDGLDGVHQRLVELLGLLLGMLGAEDAEPIGGLAHLRQCVAQRIGLGLSQEVERQSKLEQAVGDFLALPHQRGRLLGHVLHLRVQTVNVTVDLLEELVVR
mmetsp:Transcript_20913/g.59638  ORF Transcript_20913/g.59638 Transcript_20913/m.59638 type:complete len:270 (+) Transcript_20913:391-1200(+)